MPQELLTAVAFLAPGIAAGFFYAAAKGTHANAWSYLGYAFAFSALDIAFVMGIILLMRGRDYQLGVAVHEVDIYLLVLLLSIAGAVALYIAMRLKDLVVSLVKGMVAAMGKGNGRHE